MFDASRKAHRQLLLRIVTILGVFAFGFGIYLLFTPTAPPLKFVRGPVVQISDSILLGPYPVDSELRELKRLGVTEVVSLLDATSPVESQLLASEKRRVERLGFIFTNYPIPVSRVVRGADPPVMEAIASHLSRSTEGLRYVHCYLGRHRVGMVQDYLKSHTKIKIYDTVEMP